MAGKANFEQSLNSLEEQVKQLEQGDLPLDKALEIFETGVKLYKECNKILEVTEQRVVNLLKENEKV